MNKYEVDSTYRQFYIADSGIEQDAPDEWSDDHIAQHYNALENIVALVTDGDITARIICFSPNEKSNINEPHDFEAASEIEIPSGSIGVYEWPWEKLEEHQVPQGRYRITFRGYNTSASIHEQDYYTVEIENA